MDNKKRSTGMVKSGIYLNAMSCLKILLNEWLKDFVYVSQDGYVII